ARSTLRGERRAAHRGGHCHARSPGGGRPRRARARGGARMSTVVAVPVKDLVNAKQRLMSFLSPLERGELARTMLEDVLEALVCAALGGVLVGRPAPSRRGLAGRQGGDILRGDDTRGHTEGVARAQQAALARGATRFLTIPGDVPCPTAEEVATLAAALPRG